MPTRPLQWMENFRSSALILLPWCVILLLWGWPVARALGWVLLGIVVALVVGTYAAMYVAARAGGPPWYAWRQVVLALVLTPVFLLGLFLIPLAVRSDLAKWRDA